MTNQMSRDRDRDHMGRGAAGRCPSSLQALSSLSQQGCRAGRPKWGRPGFQCQWEVRSHLAMMKPLDRQRIRPTDMRIRIGWMCSGSGV